MPEDVNDKKFSVLFLFDLAKRLYSGVPRRFSRSGYAFPPRIYFLEVTRRCNLRCVMCQYRDFLENVPLQQQGSGELSYEEWQAVIESIPRFSFVSIIGGEPFVRKDLPKLLAKACERHCVHLVSNGIEVTEERAATIVDLAPRRLGFKGLNAYCTSIDGPEEQHNRIRGMDGAFQRTVAALHHVRKFRDQQRKKGPLIVSTAVIQEANVDFLPELPRIAKEAGADVVNFVTETRMHDLPDFGRRAPRTYRRDEVIAPRLDGARLEQSLNRAADVAREVHIELRLPEMPREDLIGYYGGQFDLSRYECLMPWCGVFVDRVGDVFACAGQRMGNIREKLPALWNSESTRTMRREIRKDLYAFCPGCCMMSRKA